MKICVFGVGAVGGYLAHGLAQGSHDVTAIARGPHLEAIRAEGIGLIRGGTERRVHIEATDRAAEIGPQDLLVVALKANALPGAAEAISALGSPHTTIVTAMNGLPHWYFHDLPGHDFRRIDAVDPRGVVSAALPPAQMLGCVVYVAAEIDRPGTIRVLSGDRFILGEPSGDISQRAQDVSNVLTTAGFNAPVSAHIRDDIWMKLWGNVSFNPLSALTGETLGGLATEPGLRAIAHAMMAETKTVAEAFGARFDLSIEERIDRAKAVGAHKTSMLQDLERGRPMEIDALVTAVTELGRAAGVATPVIDMILALVQARARTLGLYAPPPH